jgi:hypothetical protein
LKSLYYRVPFDDFHDISFRFLVVHISPTRTGELKQSPPAEPYAGGRHTYDGVLPGAPKGLFATL